MRRAWRIGLLGAVLGAAALAGLRGIDSRSPEPSFRRPTPRVVTRPGRAPSILGTAFSPANSPGSTDADTDRFFSLAAELGSHVALITEWRGETPLPVIREIARRTRQSGLAFFVALSPISLDFQRQHPAIPTDVAGTSFRDAPVRAAFQSAVLDLAAVEPDVLGLGTEVNLLAENAPEFDAYASMVRETAAAVRARYPRQAITVSFQWDVMAGQRKFLPLDPFRGVVDVFGFTTYPGFVGDPLALPSDYYSAIREHLPADRVALSEVGWAAADAAGEPAQAAYFDRLPEMLRAVRPEFVSLALLHDVAVFTGDLEPLNHVGVRYRDGRAKRAWDVLRTTAFPFARISGARLSRPL